MTQQTPASRSDRSPQLVLTYDRYLDNDALLAGLRTLQVARPDLLTLSELGRSTEDQPIWLATVGRGSAAEVQGRPAMWVDGNIHATEFTGAMAALHLVDLLLAEDRPDGAADQLLDQVTFYVVPRLNPDGAARAMAASPELLRSGTRPYPWDEPRLGLHAADIDGDGRILQMRVKDPAGDWQVSPQDPRLMVKRRAFDQGGSYYRVFAEGRFEGRYDGHLIHPAPALPGLDFNRNFPNGWRPEGEQGGAGDFPGSEPEIQAVLRFFAAHRTIFGALTLHTFSRALLRPFSDKADEQMDTTDLWLYEAIGRRGTDLTGYPAVSVFHHFKYHPKEVISGAFDDWAYCHLGVLAYTVELWDLPTAAGIAEKNEQKRFIEWFRDHPVTDDEQILAFVLQQAPEALVTWRPYQHPQLGAVEIGGWDGLYSWRNPPAQLLLAEIAPVSLLARDFATLAARLTWRDISATALGPRRHLLRVALENQGYLSTSGSVRGRLSGVARPVQLRLELPAGARLLSGQHLVDLGHIEGRSHRVGLTPGSSPTDNRRVVEWLVEAGAGDMAQITVNSDRGGALSGTVTFG
ncbi:MAG: carboxypeptidase [Ardenticatenia bacterium]|nr:carboxypeptidase [Ardenticatenia bacterium]